jgi:hypothetical protein
VALAGALVAVAAVAYVVAPPKGLDGYRESAAASAKALGSQIETAALWSEVLDQGKTTTPAAKVGLEGAEEDAKATASEFESYEPTAGAAALRSRFAALAGEATTALADLRLAAQQGRWDEVPKLSAPLPVLSNQLARFEERAEP